MDGFRFTQTKPKAREIRENHCRYASWVHRGEGRSGTRSKTGDRRVMDPTSSGPPTPNLPAPFRPRPGSCETGGPLVTSGFPSTTLLLTRKRGHGPGTCGLTPPTSHFGVLNRFPDKDTLRDTCPDASLLDPLLS